MNTLQFANSVGVIGPVAYLNLTQGKILAGYINSTPFQKTFVIRGVGYRGSIVANYLAQAYPQCYQKLDSSFSTRTYVLTDYYNAYLDTTSKYEFSADRYLVLRVGHSAPSYLPIPNHVRAKIMKKDRKLTLFGQDIDLLSIFAHSVHKLRPPSAYTGRGIRFKGRFVRRKLGKKDTRKGRFF